MAERATGTLGRSGHCQALPHRQLTQRGDPVTQAFRLRRSTDIRSTLRSGAKAGGPAAVVHARRRPGGGASRVTVVAGRRLGNAVARNRAKRRLRAAVSEAELAPGFDFVVLAHPGALTADYPTLHRTVAASVGRAVARAEGGTQ